MRLYRGKIEAISDEVDLLVVVGGDGTIREAVAGLGAALTHVKLGIVPMGHANVVARELGIPLAPGPAIDALLNGVSVRVDVGRALV